MSDANRTKIGFVKETTYGTQPATPAFKNLRITASGLTFGPVYEESKELRSDRALQDLLHTANNVGGTLPFELSWRSLDDLLEYLLQSTWVRTPVRDNNGTADSEITDVSASTGIYTILTTGSSNTDYHYGAFAVGQLVRASGFTNSANNGLYRVSAAGATSVTLGNSSTAESAPAAAARLKVVGFRGATGDLVAAASAITSTALDFTTLGLAAGMWIKVGGTTTAEQFATAACNGWARISAVAAQTLTLDNLPTGWTTDAGTGKTLTVFTGDYLRNGTTEASMTIEEQYTDLTVPEYDYLTGMSVDQMDLAIKAKAAITGTLTFKGATGSNTTTRTSGATDIAAPTNDVLTAAANVAVISDAGTALTALSAVIGLDLTVSNALRDVPAVGSMGNVDIASGSFRAKGKLAMYYASNTIRTKLLASTSSSVVARLKDATAPVGERAYTFDFPKVKYDAGNPNTPGIDQDRTIDLEFSALAHATLAYAMHLQRTEEYAP